MYYYITVSLIIIKKKLYASNVKSIKILCIFSFFRFFILLFTWLYLVYAFLFLQNPLTLESVKQLIAGSNKEELQKCFGARMAFGTAGLRAAMGAGISHMNDLTIIQTTQVPHLYMS